MSLEELRQALNTLYFAAFTLGVLVALAKLWLRVRDYGKAEWQRPKLLTRDLVLFTGLGITFLFVFAARLLPDEIRFELTSNVAWTVLTGTPPVVAVWLWVYFEFFKLDGPKK